MLQGVMPESPDTAEAHDRSQLPDHLPDAMNYLQDVWYCLPDVWYFLPDV